MERELQVETRILKADYSSIKDQILKCEYDVEELKEILEELKMVWSGQASDAFALSSRESISKIDQSLERLRRMQNSLNKAGISYEKTEQHLKDKFESIRI